MLTVKQDVGLLEENLTALQDVGLLWCVLYHNLGGDFLWLKFTQSLTNKKLTLKGKPNDSLTGLLGKMHFPVPLSNLLLLPNDFRQLFISRVWQNACCPRTQSINVYCYYQLLGRASYSPTIRATVHTLKSTHELTYQLFTGDAFLGDGGCHGRNEEGHYVGLP